VKRLPIKVLNRPALRHDLVPAIVRPVQSPVEAIYHEHGATVTRWVLRLGGPRFDAEDAVQEVFAIVTERVSEFRGEAKLTTWLYGITENVVSEQRRRARVRRWFSSKTAEMGEEVKAPGPLAPEAMEQIQATQRLYRALDRMREPYRSTLILFELEELSGEEISELKRAKIGTIWVWLHRARAQLARHLNDLMRDD
jgi:RNA polymerase sigma-70 factor, ECF subfamily